LRFISKYAAYKISAIPSVDHYGTGQPKKRGVVCEFKLDYLHPWEIDAARSTFQFRGVAAAGPIGSPIIKHVDPIGRVSVYDTEEAEANGEYQAAGVSREDVERALLSKHSLGRDFILVEKPAVPAPWPAYDKLTTSRGRDLSWVVEQIVSRVQDLGVDPISVIEYERANRNRPEVIDALRKIGQPAEEEVVEVAA